MNAIIIEDEPRSRNVLRQLLAEYCPSIEISGEAGHVMAGVELIRSHQPNIVFLDIELPQKNGFALFDYFPNPEFSVIFTTAYDQYAVQAFRMSAIDYLLKPIDPLELQEAVNRVKKEGALKQSNQHIQVMKENLKSESKKLGLPSSNGLVFVTLKEIIRCEASRNYSLFYLSSGEKIIVSKPLKMFSDLLEEFSFFRINRSHLINLSFIKSYTRTKQGEITMDDGAILSLSDKRKEAFLEIVLKH
ncbi:MAG: response regulator transcription factor [Bacteroidetes bacterium]|jgi:two-component system LytT family response regulator|nr:response regulator transcription factor [Bacteroidota bacterium]